MRGRFTAAPRDMCGANFSTEKPHQTVSNPQWHTEDTGRSCNTCVHRDYHVHYAQQAPPMGSPALLSHLHLRKPLWNGHHRRAAQHYRLIYIQGNHRRMATTDGQPSVTVSAAPEETTRNSHHRWAAQHCCLIYTRGNHHMIRLEKDEHELLTGLSNPRAPLQSTPVPPQLNPSQTIQSEWRVQTGLYHIVQCLLVQTTVQQVLTLCSLGRTDVQMKLESQEVAVMCSQLLHGPTERSACSALPGAHTWVLPIAGHGAPRGFRAVGVGQHWQGWRSDIPTRCQPQGWQAGSSPPHPHLPQSGAH